MSGRNTKIAASKLNWGVKLPHESSGIGDGYASPGPVTTYSMDKEEILERYGPILRKRRVATDLSEYWRKKKEAKKNMEACSDILESVNAGQEPKQPDKANFETAPEPKTRIRIEIAREMLTKEHYLAMKAEGKSDTAISKEIFGKYKPSIMTGLKREWGMDLNSIIPPKPKSEKTETEPARKMTITEAIELRDKLTNEVESLSYLLQNASDKLQRLQKIFEKETITL